MSELVLYDTARKALAEARNTDEVKGIRDKSKAVEAYARQAKDKELQANAWEITRRAERRLGELMAEQRDAVGMAPSGRPKIGSMPDPILSIHTLADAGIDKHLADKARKAAAVPEESFEKAIDKKRDNIINGAHVSNASGENEWYAPAVIVEAARSVLGGIDVDPASSKIANETVKAGTFYDIAHDGLDNKKWEGAVWMNPPYSHPLIKEFTRTFADKYASGEIRSGCVLVNNATETEWFQYLAQQADSMCLIRGRVKFIDKEGEQSGAPLQGQAVLYFGGVPDVFADRFKTMGMIWRNEG